MARNSDLEGLPKVPYEELTKIVKTGDLLFYSGDDEVSKLIRWATNSHWSHVGILFKIESLNRLLLLESVESYGVRLIPLSKYIHNGSAAEGAESDSRLIVARHSCLDDEKVSQLINFGIEEITQPYDSQEISRIMIRIATGEGKKERDRAYICSELIHECFLSAGIEIPYNEKGFISPEDIWIDPQINVIVEINH